MDYSKVCLDVNMHLLFDNPGNRRTTRTAIKKNRRAMRLYGLFPTIGKK
jgi:hypothetical protein